MRASRPCLLMAARSKARAASCSVSWSPRLVVLPPAEIYRATQTRLSHQTTPWSRPAEAALEAGGHLRIHDDEQQDDQQVLHLDLLSGLQRSC